jgi:hypothetical protein
MSKIQLRGHCQVCGNEQAVVNGRMSKHGYTVKNGWFNGVCQGHQHEPIEVSRVYADETIETIKAGCIKMQEYLDGLLNGSIKPTHFTVYNYKTRKDEVKPVEEFSPYEYKNEFNHLVYKIEKRIQSGEHHIQWLTTMIAEFHGKPLREVDVDANKPEAIQFGEKRIINDKGTVASVLGIDGARVYYKCAGYDGKEYTTWQSSRAWRTLQKVA